MVKYMKACEWCGTSTKNPKFCSLSCSAKRQRSAAPVSPKKIRSCQQCGQEFPLAYSTEPKRFCSRSCSASFNNRFTKSKPGTSRTCSFEECNLMVSYRLGRYCSNKCANSHKRKELISRFLAGEDVSTVKRRELPRAIRDYLLDASGKECSVCGWGEINPTTGRVPLQIDHEDGDASNNRIDNLRVLCPNCHSLTPTFGSQNIGRGRAWRYQSSKTREKREQ